VLSTNNKVLGYRIRLKDKAATGGTYTLTAFTETTAALNYNSNVAVIESALNGLTNVAARGNCVVTGDLTTGLAINFTNAALTSNVASLTPSGSTITHSITDGGIGRVQRITFQNPTRLRDLYVASHGLSIGDTLFVKADGNYYASVTTFTTPDAYAGKSLDFMVSTIDETRNMLPSFPTQILTPYETQELHIRMVRHTFDNTLPSLTPLRSTRVAGDLAPLLNRAALIAFGSWAGGSRSFQSGSHASPVVRS